MTFQEFWELGEIGSIFNLDLFARVFGRKNGKDSVLMLG